MRLLRSVRQIPSDALLKGSPKSIDPLHSHGKRAGRSLAPKQRSVVRIRRGRSIANAGASPSVSASQARVRRRASTLTRAGDFCYLVAIVMVVVAPAVMMTE